MKLSNFGRRAAALVLTLAAGVSMTSCGSGTIGYMYVLGSLTNSGNYGQISGFKIDDQSGNLTNMVNSPFASNGVNPGNAVILDGGRYLFVLNKGTGGTTGYVTEYLIGGDGILTYENTFYSQGLSPQWITADSTGQYLYVLDETNPDGLTDTSSKVVGDVTIFTLSADTGHLTLITNQQQKYTTGPHIGEQLPYFPVGESPTMMKTAGNYLYTMDTGNQTIFIDASGGGQLVPAASSVYQVAGTGVNLTSINSDPGGRYVFLTDSGNNQLLQYQIGTNGALSGIPTGNTTLPVLTSNPVWSMVSANEKFLYVVSQTYNQPNVSSSGITAYTLSTTTGQPQLIPDSPYPAGSGPVCMVEDPTNQYVYVSNHNDSTVTGYVINANTGQLSGLTHGSVFPVSGQAACLVVSGYTS